MWRGDGGGAAGLFDFWLLNSNYFLKYLNYYLTVIGCIVSVGASQGESGAAVGWKPGREGEMTGN